MNHPIPPSPLPHRFPPLTTARRLQQAIRRGAAGGAKLTVGFAQGRGERVYGGNGVDQSRRREARVISSSRRGASRRIRSRCARFYRAGRRCGHRAGRRDGLGAGVARGETGEDSRGARRSRRKVEDESLFATLIASDFVAGGKWRRYHKEDRWQGADHRAARRQARRRRSIARRASRRRSTSRR